MPEALIHPTAQELTAFGLGKLPERRAAAVAAHLESCPACRKAVADVPPDSFLGKVRDAKLNASSLPARSSDAPGIENAPASSAPPKDLPPDLANYSKYRFVRELGRGGMGVVYQAEQTVMGRTVAVKVINPSVLDHPDALPRFQGEVKAAAKLDHPNIVRAHDAEQVGSMHLLVMEYVEGTSLAELVAKKGPLPVAYACHFIRQAALGLQHAFEQGMVHRDIKPHNLMVNARGQVKVLDFGLARMRSERKVGGGLTQADAFMGTPEYVSPEQATDARSADTRADIYSLGCTLFFLLAGRPPFQGDTVVKLIMAHIEKEAPALHAVCPGVPSELSAVVARMLAKDPAHRFQTPVEVAQALAAFVKPGTKQPVAGVVSPAAGVSSPATGTMLSADTSKIKAILGDVAGKVPAQETPAKETAGSAFAGMGESVASAKKKVKPAQKAAKPVAAAAQPSSQKKWLLGGGIGVGVLLLALLGMWAGGMFAGKVQVKTKDGSILVVEVNEPDPEILVDGKTVTVSWHNGGKKAEISVSPGSHKVQVKKDGFSVDARELTFKDGGKEVFTARLLPEQRVAKADIVQPEKPPTTNPRPVDTPAPPTRRNDYDDLAKGRWVPILTGPGEKVVIHGGATFNDGVLELRDGRAVDRTVHAKDTIMRAKVKKLAGLNISLWLRKDGRKAYGAWYNGNGQFGVGRFNSDWKWIDLLPRAVQGGVNDDQFFELAFAAVGDSLTVYVNGKRILQVRDTAVGGPGEVAVTATKGYGQDSLGLFKDIEVQVLDKLPAEVNGPAEDKEFKPLFNGKDLTGWKTHPKQPNNWKVVDGAIVGSGPMSHLYSERGDYENFHYLVEAMINDGGNSGQYFRTESGPGFPKGYEAAINSTHGDPIRTGSLYPSFGKLSNDERDKIIVKEQLVKPNEWFTQEVIAEGNHIVIKVNGKTTVDFMDTKNTYKKGHFALQQHDSGTLVKFRKIEIKELPVAPSAGSAAGSLPPEVKEAAKAYTKACADARMKLLADFDTAVGRLANMKGSSEQRLKLIEVVKAEKKRFEDKGLIPWSEPMWLSLTKFVTTNAAAEEKVHRAYNSIILAQHKAKNEGLIADLQADLARVVNNRILAKWRVISNGKLPGWVAVLHSDGRIYGMNGKPTNGTWTFSKGVLVFRWPDPKAPRGAWLDSSSVSADGTTYAGSNNAPPAMRAKFAGTYLKDD